MKSHRPKSLRSAKEHLSNVNNLHIGGNAAGSGNGISNNNNNADDARLGTLRWTPPPRRRHDQTATSVMPLMGGLCVGSLLAALALVVHLEPTAKISLSRGGMLFLLGLTFFYAVYNFVTLLLQYTVTGSNLVRRHKMTLADIYDISNKLVSTIQAIFSCVTGTVICDYSCARDVVRTSHHASHSYSWFGAAYFFYDIWSMYRVHRAKALTSATFASQDRDPALIRFGRFLRYIHQNPLIVGHHLFIGIFGFSVIIYLRGNLGDCVFGFVFLMEASTPFVSIRAILSRFDMKSTRVYVFNGLVMLFIFFLCRIAMFPYVMMMYARAAQLDLIGAILSLPTGCKISISILMLPQLYWFCLMVKGASKILVTKQHKNHNRVMHRPAIDNSST